MTSDLSVATPERVELSLPVAGIGYRSIAYLIDAGLLFAFWLVVYFSLSLLVSDTLALFQGLSGLATGLMVLGLFATQWMYWTVCEVLWNGQTPGKRAMKIRVVRDDGSPAGLFECAVRNLCRLLDFLPALYATGLMSMLVTRQHRRLGDLLAGTVLVRQETFDLGKYDRQAGPIFALPVFSRTGPVLSTEEVELILSYVARAKDLAPTSRATLGAKFVERFGGTLDQEERQAVLHSPEATEAYLTARAQGAA